MSALSEITEISVGKFDFARKAKLFQNDSKKSITCEAFKTTLNKTVNIKFSAHTASEKILVSKYGLSLPIIVEEEDSTKFQLFSEFIPTFLEQQGEKDWELTEFLKEDEKIFLKLKFDQNKQPQFKSNIPISIKKPMDAKIHNDQIVHVTASMKFYFNFENQTAGATINVTHLDFEIDEDEEEVPSKRVKV